jgi:hypothetical protein
MLPFIESGMHDEQRPYQGLKNERQTVGVLNGSYDQIPQQAVK